MKNKSQILTIILITAVVAVIVTLATASITGNIVRVRSSNGFRVESVYTRAEIDAKLSNFATYSGVGEMFGDAKTTGQIWLGISQRDENLITITSGHTECGPNSECLFGFGGIVHPNTEYFNYDSEGIIPCDQTLDLIQVQAHSDWINGSKFVVQYLCIDKELLQWADEGFPTE